MVTIVDYLTLPMTHYDMPRLLIVEDDPLSRRYLQILLRHYYTVDAVGNGEKAFEQLAQTDYHMILLDIMLPGLSGLEILEKLQAQPETSDIPVILVSALNDPEDIARGLQLGASDYVTKPIEQEILLARLRTHLKIKQLADEKKRTIQRLEEARRLNGQLSRIASHDLKNPLHNIQIAGHLLRDEVLDNNRAMKLLDGIDTNLTTMQNVIRDFMDLIALQTGTIKFNLKPVWLWEVVMSVAMQYEITAERKNITLEIGEVEGEVLADAVRLEQVVANLVSNAIKYSPFGSTVCIRAEQHGTCIRLCIADEGAGVPEDEREKLFQEFAHISTRPTGNEDSTGLGLWIVRHLIAHQNGSVGADFPQKGGSIFWMQLPSTDAPDDDTC